MMNMFQYRNNHFEVWRSIVSRSPFAGRSHISCLRQGRADKLKVSLHVAFPAFRLFFPVLSSSLIRSPRR